MNAARRAGRGLPLRRPSLGLAGLLLAATAIVAAGCGDGLDAKEVLEVEDVVTGWYDAGIVGGKNKLVPTVSFRLRNTATREIRSVQLNAVFRVIGDIEELGSAFVKGIDTSGLAPGSATDSFVLRSTLGYTGEQPRMQMLQHQQFKDAKVDIFAKHGSAQWVKLAEFKIDRQLLTN